jgi:hypothetical protein
MTALPIAFQGPSSPTQRQLFSAQQDSGRPSSSFALAGPRFAVCFQTPASNANCQVDPRLETARLLHHFP